MRLLHGLGKDTDFLQGRSGRHDRAAHGIHVRLPDLQHVLDLTAGLGHAEVGHGGLVVPLGIRGRNGEELAVVRERRLRPGLHDELIRLVVVGTIALLILNGGAIGPSKDLGLAWLVTTANAELEPPATNHV